MLTACASGGSDSPIMGNSQRMPIGRQQVICGPLPDRAAAVATVPRNGHIDVQLGTGVFLIKAPLAVEEYEIPIWTPPPRGLLSRL